MWEINDERSRIILEVDSVVFQESGYWKIFCTTLPERPFALHGLPIEPRPWDSLADEFWAGVTPIGGKIDELSNPVSKDQYYGPKTKERAA